MFTCIRATGAVSYQLIIRRNKSDRGKNVCNDEEIPHQKEI